MFWYFILNSLILRNKTYWNIFVNTASKKSAHVVIDYVRGV